MSSNQYLSSKNRLFERLQQLDHTFCFPEISKDTVRFFKREFKFLDIFLSLQSFIDEPNLIDVAQKVQALFQDALVDFSELHLAEYFDFCTFKVQYKIWLIKMEIRAKYSFPKISSLPLSANKDGIDIPSFLTKFINTVMENLRDLIDDPCSALLYVPKTKEHIEDILKELKLLQNFLCFVSERFLEPQGQHHVNFFTHVLAVTNHASMLALLYFSSHGCENQDVAVLGDISVLFFLQMKLKPIQPSIRMIYIAVLQSLKSTTQSGWCPNIQNHEHTGDVEAKFLETIQHDLVDLPTNSNSSLRVALKDHLEILKEMLDILRAGIMHVPIQDPELFLRDIDIVIIDTGLLIYSLDGGEEEDEDEDEKEVMAPGEVNPTQVLDLSGNIQRIITTIRKVFQSNLPRIHGLGYVDVVLNNLKEFQIRHSHSLASVTNQLQIIQKEFEILQPFLESIAEERNNNLNKIQHCATLLIAKAYEVEYIVDTCMSKECPVWCVERWLLDIMEEITLTRVEVVEIQENKMVGDAMNTVTTHTSSNLARSPRMNEEVVGFEDVIEKLRDQLIKGTRGRDVISIVGMPGLGKTTLAYRLYSDRLVASHFDIRAQCCMSQVYSRKDLLLEILRDASGKDSKSKENRADHELADELRKALLSRRYLILVDDVWEASAWDDLKGCFQDANNGSRIILTTRIHEVSNYARFQSDPLLLRMFREDESWELLQKKVFDDKSCPPLLRNIGLQIAKKCGRLPLSVALVAGILAKMEKKEECWEQLANNLGPYIHKDSRAIIEQSYQMLPYHLRSCFLYFGAFLEDSVINVSKLTRLWISEGFVKCCEGKNLEDIAEGYLENLYRRNLVMDTKKNSRGKIKACRIHDLLHDFCKERAKEENYLQWLKWDQNANSSSRVCFPEQLANRMSIYGEGYRIGEWSLCWSHVCSIIVLNSCLEFDTTSHNLYNFKFLKVLNLESTTIGSFPIGLVYLRYFAAYLGEDLSISSFITNRYNLETLKLENYFRESESLPTRRLCNEMVKLRHLHISPCSFTADYTKAKLCDLKTLSTPCFSHIREAERILGKTPNLRELKCIIKGVDEFEFYILKFPTWIETLKICCNLTFRTVTIPFFISAPNLKNLTLERFYLYPQHLLQIGRLKNLQVLKLKRIKFYKKEWEVSNGEFLQLKVLKLHGILCFEEWIVAEDAFPNLERLVLRYCRYVKEIPSYIGDISSLMSIEVKDCNESVNNSARDIWEAQVEDYQNSGFEIFIHEGEK